MFEDKKYKDYASLLVRVAIGTTFLLIGISQMSKPISWTAWIPSFILSFPITPVLFIIITGTFNIIVGFLLLSGILTRLAALLAALHLAGILATIGYNDIFMRDLGLFLASLSILLRGADNFCLDNKFRRSVKGQ